MSIDTLTGEIPDGPEPTPLERERMRADVAESDLQIAMQEIIRLNRSLAAHKAEVGRRTQATPHGKMATLISRYYVLRLGKDEKRWKFGEKREKATLARLKEEYEPLFICRAIDGLAVGAHVDRDSGVRYDDLELVCRNEVNLERFHQLAEKNNADTLLNDEWRAALTGTTHLTDVPDHPTN